MGLKLVLLIIMLGCIHPAEAELKVIYPNFYGVGEQLVSFEILRLALENSGCNFKLSVAANPAADERVRVMLRQKTISIADFGTSAEFEREFSPIYFPVDLGLSGWRIFLIHKDNQADFKRIFTLQDLQRKTAGQGLGWSDVAVLVNARIEVVTASKIASLFKMTEKKRFDFLPLGAHSAYASLEQYQALSPSVVVEKNILLRYPFARLFFVHKENQSLHDAVKKGMLKIFASGQLLQLIRYHPTTRSLFEQVNLLSRTEIKVDNMNMTHAFKQMPEEYFFSLEMLKSL